MPRIHIVNEQGDVLPIPEAYYHDIGDAAGDINGGDFWSFVREEYPEGITLKEIRILDNHSTSE